jgi:DNA uptake protein ComE-like DNA-binding protein
VKHASLLDLNTATAPELEKLPGIGQASAAKIVAGRPFKSKSELLSRGLVNQDQYSKLSPYVIAKQATAAATKK